MSVKEKIQSLLAQYARYILFALPFIMLLLNCLSQRKRTICLQKYPPNECKKSPISFVFLMISCIISGLAVLKSLAKEKEESTEDD